jgi:hypothetical protein
MTIRVRSFVKRKLRISSNDNRSIYAVPLNRWPGVIKPVENSANGRPIRLIPFDLSVGLKPGPQYSDCKCANRQPNDANVGDIRPEYRRDLGRKHRTQMITPK